MSEKMDYLENSVREEVRQLVIVDRFSVDLKEKILALLDKVRQTQAAECANHAYDVIRWNFTLPELNASALSAGLASPRWNALEKQLAKALLAALGRK